MADTRSNTQNASRESFLEGAERSGDRDKYAREVYLILHFRNTVLNFVLNFVRDGGRRLARETEQVC